MANSYLGRRTRKRDGGRREAGGEKGSEGSRRERERGARPAATYQRIIIVFSFGWPGFGSSVERGEERKE